MTAADLYSWGWSWPTGCDGGIPLLSVTWHARALAKPPGSGWHDPADVDLIDDAVPPERDGELDPWDPSKPSPSDEWSAFVQAGSKLMDGDLKGAVPRLIAAHALGRDPEPSEIKAVAPLCRRNRKKAISSLAVPAAEVRAALSIPEPEEAPVTQQTLDTPAVELEDIALSGKQADALRILDAAGGRLRHSNTTKPGVSLYHKTADALVVAGLATHEGDDVVITAAGHDWCVSDRLGAPDEQPSPTTTFPADASPRSTRDAWVTLLPVDELAAALDNIRRDLGDLDDLTTSIRTHGVLEPVIVTPQQSAHPGVEDYVIVAGHRRVAAARQAGLAAVPCIVRDLDDAQRLEVMLIENLQRADLAPLDEARAYRRLADEFGYSASAIAKAVGRSQPHVSDRLRMLDLPEQVQLQIGSQISATDARQLVKLHDDPDALEAALAEISAGESVEYAVDHQLAEAKRRRARDAEIARLRDEGLVVVDAAQARTGTDLPQVGKLREVATSSWNGVTMEPRDHAKLDCHVVAVLHDGTAVPACKNAGSHKATPPPHPSPGHAPSDDGDDFKAQQAERDKAHVKKNREDEKAARAARARAEALDAAHTRRFAYARQAAKAPINRRTLDHVCRLVVEGADFYQRHLALKLLERAPRANTTNPAAEDQAWAKAVDELDPARIAVALALAEGEQELRTYAVWTGRQIARAHLEYLQTAAGYTPADVEADLLADYQAQDVKL